MDINNLTVLFTSIPGRYALALFNEGKKSDCLNDIAGNFKTLDVFFHNNATIKKLLVSKCISENELDKSWLAVGQHLSFCPIFISFIRQVGINKRFDVLDKINYIFKAALAKHKNKRNVTIISAVNLLPEQKNKIESVVSTLFTEKALITYEVDNKILGGIKISSEEKVYDASVYNQLKQVYKYFKKTKVM